MRPEDVEQQFRALKAGLESSAITEDEFEAEIRTFLFEDESGSYWAIGAQTGKWYRHEDGEWVRAAPPVDLRRAESKMGRPYEAPDSGPSAPRRLPPAPVLIALTSLFLVACLATVAVASYQYGRMSVLAPLPTESGPPIVAETPSVTARPAGSPTSGDERTPAAGVATPSLPVTVERDTPTSTIQLPRSTPTRAPIATATAAQVLTHRAPILLGPEDGVERGPGYYAILAWEPGENLLDNEYYHVEVCWNNCTAFESGYVKDTTWIFPDFHRGEAIDATYHWHVTVRRQVGDVPAGPADPATSPTSDTWKFRLPGP